MKPRYEACGVAFCSRSCNADTNGVVDDDDGDSDEEEEEQGCVDFCCCILRCFAVSSRITWGVGARWSCPSGATPAVSLFMFNFSLSLSLYFFLAVFLSFFLSLSLSRSLSLSICVFLLFAWCCFRISSYFSHEDVNLGLSRELPGGIYALNLKPKNSKALNTTP